VSDFDGPAEFYVNAWNVTSALRMFTDHCFGIGVPRDYHMATVEVRRVESLVAAGLLPPRADIIMLDVQGSDLEVIQGGRDFFRESKMVYAEVCFRELYVGQKLYEAIQDELISLGFVPERVVAPDAVERQRASWTDILFTKK
jgi:hypothetical protein